ILTVYDAATGAVIHSRSVSSEWWSSQWLLGSKAILIRGQRDEFTLVKAESGAEMARFKAPDTYELQSSSDGRLLAGRRVSGSKQADLVIWERLTSKEVARLPVGKAAAGFNSEELFVDNKSFIAVNDHAIEVWDLATQQARYRLTLDYELGGV